MALGIETLKGIKEEFGGIQETRKGNVNV